MKKQLGQKKVFLLGDFSGYHVNLSSGLEKNNISSIVFSTGDSWKKIKSDISISPPDETIYSKFMFRVKLLLIFLKIKNYDVVQIMNFHSIYFNFFPTKFVINYLKKNNKKVFILAAGSDPFYWHYGRINLEYGPFNDVLKYDLNGKMNKNQNQKLLDLNEYIARKCDGVIPIMYDYLQAYKHLNNCRDIIQIPLNLDKYNYSDNVVNDKVVFFHGINKPGFKGTHYVKVAFDMLKNKYPNDVEVIIDGKLPLNEYLKLIERTNVIIDQVNSQSLGVNGVIALALGKVVVGGAEQESLKSFGLSSVPYINIKPSVDDIFEKLESLLINKSSINDIGVNSRRFVESFHSDKFVAEKFIECWFKDIC